MTPIGDPFAATDRGSTVMAPSTILELWWGQTGR